MSHLWYAVKFFLCWLLVIILCVAMLAVVFVVACLHRMEVG